MREGGDWALGSEGGGRSPKRAGKGAKTGRLHAGEGQSAGGWDDDFVIRVQRNRNVRRESDGGRSWDEGRIANEAGKGRGGRQGVREGSREWREGRNRRWEEEIRRREGIAGRG